MDNQCIKKMGHTGHRQRKSWVKKKSLRDTTQRERVTQNRQKMRERVIWERETKRNPPNYSMVSIIIMETTDKYDRSMVWELFWWEPTGSVMV